MALLGVVVEAGGDITLVSCASCAEKPAWGKASANQPARPGQARSAERSKARFLNARMGQRGTGQVSRARVAPAGATAPVLRYFQLFFHAWW